MAKNALVIISEGFEDIEAVAPIDVLTRAGVKVTISGLASDPVRAAYGITLIPHIAISSIDKMYDCVVIPGGRVNAENLAANRAVVEIVQRHAESGRLVAAICAAPSHVLGEAAGILKNVRATGDPGFNQKLGQSGAIVTNEKVTVDKNIITGMGPGAAMLFALMIAEQLVDKTVADQFAAKWQIAR